MSFTVDITALTFCVVVFVMLASAHYEAAAGFAIAVALLTRECE